MNDTLERMPAESVAMMHPPLGRWYGGAVWRYDESAQVWRKYTDYPEDKLTHAQKTMLERTRQRAG